MADPLSIAGLALAVVSLGLQVTGGITGYFDSLESRDQDIASMIQQNDTLRKTLQIIESSISRFQNDHRTETEALRQFLDSSNEELKSLESMVATLIADDQGTTGRRSKARNTGKKLLYPFHRPKLKQIATKLHHINATLQLGLQGLGLSVSHLGSEKLATLQATSQTISSDLLVVQSEVSSISTPIRGIQSAMSQFETRFDGIENLLGQLLVQGSTMNGTLQEITPALVAGRLLRKPAVLQEMCDTVGDQGRHKPNKKLPTTPEHATETRRVLNKYTGGQFSCLCHDRRQFQRKRADWGSWRFSHETAIEQHLPGCPATEAITEMDRSNKFTLTYIGLRSLLSSAIELSFSIRSGAGGWSLAPNFTFYPIVDSRSAPAFRMVSLLDRSGFYIGPRSNKEYQEELISSVVSSILKLFRAKKASPRAVDDQNRSLVHHITWRIGVVYELDDLSQSQDDGYQQSSPILDLVQYLLVNKAPANEYDIYGLTAIGTLFSTSSSSSIANPGTAACVELILRSNAEDALAFQSRVDNPRWMRMPGGLRQETYTSIAVLLNFLSRSPEIARACGCGPLGLAILSNNLEEVKFLVAHHPSTLSERTIFGQTPLHLATDKPSILRVLVGAADTALLNQTEKSSYSALELAVSLSGLKCKGEKTQMCKRCTCAESAVILSRADCAIPVSPELPIVLETASKRCRLRYVRYMKDRRGRLKQLALDNLSETDFERLGLRSEHTLDYNAFEVTRLLEENGMEIPASLSTLRSKLFPYPVSVYQELDSPEDADVFFQVGFRDTWAWCSAYNMRPEYIIHPPELPLRYLRWLATHGGISCQLPLNSRIDIFGCQWISSAIGIDIRDNWNGRWSMIHPSAESENTSLLLAPCVPHDEIAWLHEVHATVFATNIGDACCCKCSIEGCTMLRLLLEELVVGYGYGYEPRRLRTDSSENKTPGDTESIEGSEINHNPLLELTGTFIRYLEHFSSHLRLSHHYATLRYITHVALGIHHSCCVGKDSCPDYEDPAYSVEDGFEDDESHKLALLEDLLGEFEESITSILEDPEKGVRDLIYFWEIIWVSRMSEVLDRLEGSDLSEDDRLAAEEIGVVWDRVGPEPPQPGPGKTDNPYPLDMVEHWLHELRKIEAECQ